MLSMNIQEKKAKKKGKHISKNKNMERIQIKIVNQKSEKEEKHHCQYHKEIIWEQIKKREMFLESRRRNGERKRKSYIKKQKFRFNHKFCTDMV